MSITEYRRDETVDIVKGLAIIFMVLGHTRFSQFGNTFINMFNMPLFFFCSGYCFKEKYLQDFKKFATKRVTGIYYPFVKWCLLFLLLHNVFFHLNLYNSEYGDHGMVSHLYSLKEFVTHGFYIVSRLSHFEQLLGGYWFLHTLFFASFIFYFTLRADKSKCILGGAILFVITILCLYYNLYVPYFWIEPKELLAAFFIMIGFIFKKEGFLTDIKYVFLFLCIVLVVFGTIFWPCNMLTLSLKKVVPYTITAIAGIVAIFIIGRTITMVSWLKFFKLGLICVGNNTLQILTWHFLSFKIVSLVIISAYTLPKEQLAEYPVIEAYSKIGWWVLYLAVGVGIPVVVCKIKEKVTNSLSKRTFINER